MLRKLFVGASGALLVAACGLAGCSGDESADGSGATGALGSGGLGVAGTLGGGGLGIAGIASFDAGFAGFGGAAGSGTDAGGAAGVSGSGGAAGAAGSGGAPVVCTAPAVNCDGDSTCETDLSASSNSCANAEDLGIRCSDAACDYLLGCASVVWKPNGGAQGKGSRWFWATAVECSLSCQADVVANVALKSPPGTNYDLFVYQSCGKLVASSTLGPGEIDAVAVKQEEVSGLQGFNYVVEVRWVSGGSCGDWQLQLYRSGCL
ncbi:MAG: hypothetical protein R3B13_34890 [Polyangiaceae bacterium]